MGVTAHFWAFDPAVYAEPPTIDGLLRSGHLTDELGVSDSARGGLHPVPTAFSDNKTWYRNVSGELVWTLARPWVPAAERAALDHWFSHLFWEPGHDEPSPCTRHLVSVGEMQVIYSGELLAHIGRLRCSLIPARRALVKALDVESPVDDPWMAEPDGFEWLVDEWSRTLGWPPQNRPGWSLLRWVWV